MQKLISRIVAFIAMTTLIQGPLTAQGSVYQQLKNTYLPATQLQPTEPQLIKPKPTDAARPNLSITPLTDIQKKTAIFDLLSSKESSPQAPLFDQHTWRDLELYSQANFLKRINRTKTALGEAVLCKMIAYDTTSDIAQLQANQHVVKELTEKESTFQKLDHSLERIAKAEPLFLHLYEQEDPAVEKYLAPLYFSWFSFANKTSSALEARTDYGTLSSLIKISGSHPLWIGFNVSMAAIAATLAKKFPKPAALQQMGNGAVDQEPDYLSTIKGSFFPRGLYNAVKGYKPTMDGINEMGLPLQDPEEIATAKKAMQLGVKIGAATAILTTAGVWAYLAYSGYSWLSYQKEALAYMQTRLIALASVVKSLKEINALAQSINGIDTAIPEMQAIRNVFDPASPHSDQFKKLIGLLQTGTFEGEPSFFSQAGHILAAHALVKDVKHELRDALEAVGKVDAYLSAAKLYSQREMRLAERGQLKDHARSDNQYCFVSFAAQNKPYLSLTNFWNPLLGSEKAIPNSLELGTSTQRNMILTGQNTAGKTTVLKAISYCIILGQLFGIAPASAATFTPFSLFNSHVIITDDISSEKSSFAVEVDQAKKILDSTTSLNSKDFCFTVIDEMFRTTGPEHAEELSYNYAKKLAERHNAIIIESTHYPKLIKLEQEAANIYTNYKMEIHKQEDGSLLRPYKLEKGFTLSNIAGEILQEQGLVF